jgi:hypothetical protein
MKSLLLLLVPICVFGQKINLNQIQTSGTPASCAVMFATGTNARLLGQDAQFCWNPTQHSLGIGTTPSSIAGSITVSSQVGTINGAVIGNDGSGNGQLRPYSAAGIGLANQTGVYGLYLTPASLDVLIGTTMDGGYRLDVQSPGSGGLFRAGSFTVNVAGNPVFTSITGITQCLEVNSSGVVSGSGAVCGGGSGGGTVNTSGSPSIGNLTMFSGATTITNANLIGDVTTTNTLATTVVAVGGKSISLSGAFATTGAFNLTFAVPSSGIWTLPSPGTLVNSSVTTLSSLSSIGTIGTGVWQATPIAASYLPTGSSSARGILQGDGSTLSITSGVVSCTTATVSQLGCVEVDGTSITISGGVISATAAASPYTTTFTGQTSVSISAATHGHGTLAEAACFDSGSPRSAVLCSYTRDSSGNMVFIFNPAFSGQIEIR